MHNRNVVHRLCRLEKREQPDDQEALSDITTGNSMMPYFRARKENAQTMQGVKSDPPSAGNQEAQWRQSRPDLVTIFKEVNANGSQLGRTQFAVAMTKACATISRGQVNIPFSLVMCSWAAYSQ